MLQCILKYVWKGIFPEVNCMKGKCMKKKSSFCLLSFYFIEIPAYKYCHSYSFFVAAPAPAALVLLYSVQSTLHLISRENHSFCLHRHRLPHSLALRITE